MFDISGALPEPNEAFAWVQGGPLPRLECRPLARIASHFFTTREWRLGSRDGDPLAAWAEVAAAAGVDPSQLARAHQVHGAAVVHAGEALASNLDADVLLTEGPDVWVTVQVADCVPLLVADRRTGGVAAAHAGWRGQAAGVPGVTVRALARDFGSRPEDLIAAIGPSIGACCYEVGRDVIERFEAGGFGGVMQAWFSDAPLGTPRNPSMPGVGASRREGRWFFDGWRATRDQLRACGVPDDQIFTAGLCTASHPRAFCSHRRDGAPAGRLAAAISPARRP
jgi:YfiH family protein